MATPKVAVPGAGQSLADRFRQHIGGEITALQNQMLRLGNTALVAGERTDAADHCLAGIARLSQEVKDASGNLPAHDLKEYTDVVKALRDQLEETQAQFAPKPKFSFKTKKNDSAVSLHEAAELADQKKRSLLTFSTASSVSSVSNTPFQVATPPNEPASPSRSGESTSDPSADSHAEASSVNADRPMLTTTATTTLVNSASNVHIILPPSASRALTPCTLSMLNSCCVDLSIPSTETATFPSLMITSVKSSLLLCGSIAGPAHITGVKNSIIVISCRQLRMHECTNVDVYLYCTSRPIFEDCTGMRFTEIPQFYSDLLHSGHGISNGAIGTNKWDQVDDFKWLRPEQSPNWTTLPGEEKVSDSVWKDIIPAKPGMSLDEILNAVSIKR